MNARNIQIIPEYYYLAVSMSDLVTWVGEADEDCKSNAILKSALDTIGLNVDLRELYFKYFDETKVGEGDVFAFVSNNSNSYFVINLYRGMTDQMDIVNFGIRCENVNSLQIRKKLREFNDTCSCQVHYRESIYSVEVNEMIDSSHYPKVIEETRYEQNIHLEKSEG